MSRFTWKALGGVFPFIVILMSVDLGHPYRTCAFIGAGVIVANAVGYLEGYFKEKL